MINLDASFKILFPNYDFELKDMQKKVIGNVVEKDNTLCLMQTGGGKSLTYWVSGLMLGGITIVISPLTALIIEQATKINEQGYKAVAISGDMPVSKQVKYFMDLAAKKVKPDFIFLSPEKMATDGLLDYCLRQVKDDIKLVVIDEIHCVSQWGLSFRPSYKRIPAFLDKVFGCNSWPRVLGLTATLNPIELNDIKNYFFFKDSNIIKQDLLMRGEIQLHVERFEKEEQKEGRLLELFKIHRNEKILVYVYRKYNKHGVEDLCEFANENGFPAIFFHGDMTPEERAEIIRRYKNNEINIVFATNAFGMGIDIPDIKVVIHFMIPESVEQYYQEIGRAARKLSSANAYLMYSNKNIDVKERYFIDASFPSEDLLRKTFDKILPPRADDSVLQYFEDEEVQTCLPYFEEAGLVKIVGKGFAALDKITDIKNDVLKEYADSTKTKNLITVSKKCNARPEEIAELAYTSIVNGDAKLIKGKFLERYLVMHFNNREISDQAMQIMMNSICSKKKYKHELLDYLVYLVSNFDNSLSLHQEIAKYLGTEKFNLGRIHTAEDGTQVRSKSEVIICNLLHKNGIEYFYEKNLYGGQGEPMSPDFTIKLKDGTELYWEHLGMIGNRDYDQNWLRKLDLYDKYFPNQLVYTYESGNLSQDASELIAKIIEKNKK